MATCSGRIAVVCISWPEDGCNAAETCSHGFLIVFNLLALIIVYFIMVVSDVNIYIYTHNFLCGFDRASSLICGNKMPTRCNLGFYCRSNCLLNMFRAPLCPSSGAHEYYTVVAACGISCCKDVKIICKLGTNWIPDPQTETTKL